MNFSRACRISLFFILLTSGCASYHAPKVTLAEFPKGLAFLQQPERPFKKIGLVRSKVSYVSLDPEHEEDVLCKNYYNKAVRDLVKRARANGGDAVMEIKSVVFLFDGRQERHSTPECTDDGAEGQVLTEGIAIKWEKPLPVPSHSPAPAPAPTPPPSSSLST